MPKWSKSSNARVQRRENPVGAGTLDMDARTVEATLATGNVVNGPFGKERLLMTPEAINRERADQGLPWHDVHDGRAVGERIGIVENIRLEGGELRGRLRASRNAGGAAVLQDISDGIIRATSIGYQIDDAHYENDTLIVTNWTPLEVSTPSVVADIHSQIHRNLTMDEPNVGTAPAQDPSQDLNAAVAARVAEIDSVFAPFPSASDIRSRAFAEGWDPARARNELLAFLGSQYRPTRTGPDTVAGEDVLEKFVKGARAAIFARANLLSAEEASAVRRDNPFYGFSLAELAREYLRTANDNVRGDTRDIVGRAFVRAGIISHGTSDYANVLVDAANKAAQRAYEMAPETYEAWTVPGELPDFKQGQRPQMSGFEDLEEVGENGEIRYGTIPDYKEPIQLLSYGKLFSITRQAIINDDLTMFTRIPAAMARAAARKIGDLVYDVLKNNAAMSDGNALFSAAHANFVAHGSGGGPAVATLNAGYTAMATQTDGNSNVLNIIPQFILAAHAARGTIDALLASALNPAEGSTTSFQEANVWRARLTPIYDARIDNDDPLHWYLAASPEAGETIEVAYLNGVRTPRLEQEEGFTVDGVSYKVAMDVGVSPLDWRYLYHNDGN